MNGKSQPEPPAAAPSGARRHSMQSLGLNRLEEAVYRMLLRQPGMSALVLSQRIGAPDQPLDDLLAALQQRGLVRSSGGPGAKWEATLPEVAVELLLLERQAALNEARRILPELQQELARSAFTTATTDVQVLPADPALQLQAYLDLYDQARSSIVSLVRPPFIVAAPEAIEAARNAARQRGVRLRTVMSTAVMGWDGWQAAVAQSQALGDEVRMLDTMPFKLLMVDGAAAMLPLHADEPDGAVLRLGNTAVLTAVAALFEQLWDEAVPVGEVLAENEGSADAESWQQELITVLAAGANDKTAAHVQGISERTLQRRIALLTGRLRAKSRFQAGWLAARSALR